MKLKNILIIGLLIILIISFFWKGTDLVDEYFQSRNKIEQEREKAKAAGRWRVRTVLEYGMYKDSVEISNKQYEDSVLTQIAYRDNEIEVLKKKKTDRLNASDEELIQELHSRISNTGSPGIYKLTSGGVNYVLEVIDERDSYALANISLQKEISFINSINIQDKATIKQLESILDEGSDRFKSCNEDLIAASIRYDHLYKDHLELKVKDKKKKNIIFALSFVVILETVILVLAK